MAERDKLAGCVMMAAAENHFTVAVENYYLASNWENFILFSFYVRLIFINVSNVLKYVFTTYEIEDARNYYFFFF